MTSTVTLPFWAFAVLALLATWAALERLMMPSVRWFLRSRTNLQALQELLAPVPVLPLPWIRKPADDRYVVEIAEECGLGALVTDRNPPA